MPSPRRDLTKDKPVSEQIFQVYRNLYTYDKSPLNASVEQMSADEDDWKLEKITYTAPYGNEEETAYLYLPKKGKPPYQTVLFFPGSNALTLRHFTPHPYPAAALDAILRSGRAVIYPVYKGTYERAAEMPGLDTVSGREVLIQDSKDMSRSIDYLETRPDIDSKRIAYLGDSMSAALGVVWAAVENRFKAVIFLDGGFFVETPLPGTDQADFAPRLKAPTLLITGKFDWIFLGKDALLTLLGAPAADKKAVTFDTAHDVTEQRADLIREVVGWLDKYLGKVN